MIDTIDMSNERVKAFFACGKKNVEMMDAIVRDYKPLLMGKHFLTDSHLSEIMGLSRRTLQDYRDRGVIPFYRLDGKILYEEGEIEDFIMKSYRPKFQG